MFLFQNNPHGDLQIKICKEKSASLLHGVIKLYCIPKLKNLLVQLDKHGGALGEHCCAMSSWKLDVKLNQECELDSNYGSYMHKYINYQTPKIFFR
jgi:hypothetical protein